MRPGRKCWRGWRWRSITWQVGATMEFELIHDVFTHLIAASEILGRDADLRPDEPGAAASPPFRIARSRALSV